MTHHSVKIIQQLFVNYGDKHYQEECSQTIHAISCAWHAKQQQASSELIVSALLHDIGHFIADRDNISGFDEFGHKDHAEIGAKWLKKQGFPASVYLPIRYHVQAKRYLAYVLDNKRLQKFLAVNLSIWIGYITVSPRKLNR